MKTHLKNITLLYIEDDLALRQATVDFLTLYCGRIIIAGDGLQGLELFSQGGIDVVLTDIRMPHMDGLTFAAELKRRSPETPLLFYTAFTEIPYLLKGIELGVAGFVQKPTDAAQLLAALQRAALPIVQSRQLQGLEHELHLSVENLLGKGPRLKMLALQVERVAHTDFTVLIQGETGSGKSRLAAIIHDLSPLRAGPFVTVQLGAIPESLIAAELFGHEKGAFTGADRKREGLVKAAEGGTLFLDDIDAAPPAIQAMLLRLVEEKIFCPLGSNQKSVAKIRIIAACNKPLLLEAEEGRFRLDLYYRLAGMSIELPALRTIPEDISTLTDQFLRETCLEIGRPIPEITPEVYTILQSQPWPGNIRELRNTIRRVALFADRSIDENCLIDCNVAERSPTTPLPATQEPRAAALPLAMHAVERWALLRALDAAGGKKMVAARLLEMNYYTFRRRLARFNLDSDHLDKDIHA